MSEDGSVHPLVAAAARGELPPWAEMSDSRLDHVERVASLLGSWADAADLSDVERTRWLAAGWLHDSLKDAEDSELLALVDDDLRGLPVRVLHGPAAAARMRQEGVRDRELLDAVAYHTLGHPRLGRTGRALYAADFLEPGRDLRNKWRARLRNRMPEELDEVVRAIVGERMVRLVKRGRPMRPETVGFWNLLTGGEAWVRDSVA